MLNSLAFLWTQCIHEVRASHSLTIGILKYRLTDT